MLTYQHVKVMAAFNLIKSAINSIKKILMADFNFLYSAISLIFVK
jgi:hypothetical protein